MPRRKLSTPEVAPGAETAQRDYQDFQKTQQSVAREAEPTREGITRERLPFNSYTKKMDVFLPEKLQREFHLHKFVDRGGRIDRAKAAGYEFVRRNEVGIDAGVENRSHDLGENVTWISGTSEKGDAEVTYLMKIRKEYYEQDQADIQAQVDATDDAIRRGTIGNQQKGYLRQNTYDGYAKPINERS